MKVVALGRYIGNGAVGDKDNARASSRHGIARAIAPAGVGEVAIREKEIYERGFQEGRAAALSENAVARELVKDADPAVSNAALEAEFADRLARVVAETSARLVAIENDLHDCLTGILRPVLMELQGEVVVARLFAHLDRVLENGLGARMKIKGPPEILEYLRGRPIGDAARFDFEATEGIDIIIDCDQTRIETRLGEWMRGLKSFEEGQMA